MSFHRETDTGSVAAQQQRSQTSFDDQEDQIIDPNLYGLTGFHNTSHHSQHQHLQQPILHQLHSHTQQATPGSGFTASHLHSDTSGGPWHSVTTARQQHAEDININFYNSSMTQLMPESIEDDVQSMSATEKPAASSSADVRQGASPVVDPNLPASAPSHPTPHHQHIFRLAHGKKGKQGAVDHISDQEPIRLRHLFKRPVIRQWLYQGKLYREEDQRVCSRFELFFDLLFVGLIHQLADGLSESDEPSTMLILRFCLLFYLSFSVWQDVRHWINQSGTDDVIQRMYILIVMVLLVGFNANAVGIEIFKASEGIIESEQGLESNGETSLEGGYLDPSDANVQVGKRLIAGASRYLLTRAVEGADEEPILVQPIGSTGYWFAEG